MREADSMTPRLASLRRVAVATGAAALLAAGAAAQTVQINGAGATFPYPIYSKWFAEYNKLHPGVRINYQSIGSGGGIRQVTNRTVFFGATDGPMTEEQMRAAPAPSCTCRRCSAPSSRCTTCPVCART